VPNVKFGEDLQMCIAKSNGFDMNQALKLKKKQNHKQIQYLTTSKELICSKWLKK